MSLTQTHAPQTRDDADQVATAAGAPVRTMAIALWGVVGTLLAYGVLQTAIKASALFTG